MNGRDDVDIPAIPLAPFELHDEIGDGGMGVVWKGRHPGHDVPVAVKFITRAVSGPARYLRDFRTEVRSVAALNHPGIITVLDYGQADQSLEDATAGRLPAGCPYLVMELANAGSLTSILGELDWPLFRDLMIELLDALAHAHTRGVIHRDIKPGNVLLDRMPTGELKVKLSDFGLAFLPEHFDARHVAHDKTAGTPHYMAPEQFRARWRYFGPSTDLYGLGCLAWQLACGRTPFDGPRLVEIARRHLVEPLPAFEPTFEAPAKLQNWLATLLQKHPRDRFQRAADAAAALLALDPRLQRGADTSDEESQEGFQGSEHLSGASGSSFPAHWAPQLADVTLDTGDHLAELPDSLAHLVRQPDQQGDEPQRPPIPPMRRQPPPIPPDWNQHAPPARPMTLVGAGLELFGLRDFPMAGQQPLRDRLWERLREVIDADAPRMTVLHGPAGVGKTRLTRWLGHRAEEVGAARPLHVVHDENAAPMTGIAAVVARVVGCEDMTPEDARKRLQSWYEHHGVDDPREWQAMSVLLEPILSAGDGDPDSHPDNHPDSHSNIQFSGLPEQLALLRRFLGHLAEERPVLLHLDDIPWGRPALKLADELLSRADFPVYVVATYRDETLVERPLERDALEQLRDAHPERITTHRVPALDEEARRQLVEHFLRLSPAVAHHVTDRSEGNPLFATQLVADWIDRGLLVIGDRGFELAAGDGDRDGGDAPPELPDDLYQVWGARLDRALADCSPAERRAVELGAVLSGHPRADTWEAACLRADLPVPRGALEALLKHHLLEDTADGWTFAHTMVRETLQRRSREHGDWQPFNRLCAQLLDERLPADAPGRAERIADHLLAAEDHDAALAPLLEAIEARGSFGDLDAAAYLLERFEAAAHAAGLADDDPRAGEALVLKGRYATTGGDFDGARDLFEQVLALQFAADTELLHAKALQGLGRLHFVHEELEEASERLRKSAALLSPSKVPRLYARVLRNHGDALVRLGQVDNGLSLLDDSLQFLEGHAPLEWAKTCHSMGQAHYWAGNPGEAREHFEDALEAFRAEGMSAGMAVALNNLANVARRTGDIDRAESLLTSACTAADRIGSSDLAHIPLGRIEISLKKGEFAKAHALGEKWTKIWQSDVAPVLRTIVTALQAHAHAGLGDWQRLRDALPELRGAIEERNLISPDMPQPLTRAAELAAEAGRDDLADELEHLAAHIRNALNADG